MDILVRRGGTKRNSAEADRSGFKADSARG